MTELKENKLQDKIQLLEAKIEELEIEASTARKYFLFQFITLSENDIRVWIYVCLYNVL